jgi:type III secretion protein Q
MASIRPLPLLRLNASHAQALRRLGSQPEGFAITGLLADTAQPVVLRLSPLALSERAASVSAGLTRLTMEWAGGRLLLDLSEAAAGVWLRASLGGADYAALPADWIEPAIAHALAGISAAVETLGRGPLQLAAIGPAPADGWVDGFHPLWLEARLGAECVAGLLQLDSLSLLLLSSMMPAAGSATGPLTGSAVPMPLLLSIGQTRLAVESLRRLRPRGVVFIAEPHGEGPGELLLQTPEFNGRAWALRAALSGNSLHILERVRPMNTPSDSASEDLSASLEQLPVRLSFDLGERMVTLAELQTLDAGSVLGLDRPLQDFVTIRVNGVAVGEGQLVEMDGRLGVMVSRLSIGKPR